MNTAVSHKDRPAKRLYNLKEASLYMGRTVCALREMIWAGKLPVVKDGRRIHLDIDDIDKWIERNKTTVVDQCQIHTWVKGGYYGLHQGSDQRSSER